MAKEIGHNWPIVLVLLLVIACTVFYFVGTDLIGPSDEPMYGRWTMNGGICEMSHTDTVAFGSDFIEFYVADQDRTERINAIVESDSDQLVVRFFNDVVEPYGTFVWTLRKLDDDWLVRIGVELGIENGFEPVSMEPIDLHLCRDEGISE